MRIEYITDSPEALEAIKTAKRVWIHGTITYCDDTEETILKEEKTPLDVLNSLSVTQLESILKQLGI
jgi:hypothetical protein